MTDTTVMVAYIILLVCYFVLMAYSRYVINSLLKSLMVANQTSELSLDIVTEILREKGASK